MNDGIFRPYLDDYQPKSKRIRLDADLATTPAPVANAAPKVEAKILQNPPLSNFQGQMNNLPPSQNLQNLTKQQIQNLTEYYQSFYINQILANNLGSKTSGGKIVRNTKTKKLPTVTKPYEKKPTPLPMPSTPNLITTSNLPILTPSPPDSKLKITPIHLNFSEQLSTAHMFTSTNPVMQLSEVITREARKKMKTIDPENMYIECPVCNKKIKRLYHFQRHMRIHSGEKQHCCPYCPYKSVRKDNLNSHMKTHEKHRQLKNGCGKSYPLNGGLPMNNLQMALNLGSSNELTAMKLLNLKNLQTAPKLNNLPLSPLPKLPVLSTPNLVNLPNLNFCASTPMIKTDSSEHNVTNVKNLPTLPNLNVSPVTFSNPILSLLSGKHLNLASGITKIKSNQSEENEIVDIEEEDKQVNKSVGSLSSGHDSGNL